MIASYNKADRKAPRFRQSIASLLNKDLYKQFYEKYPEYKKYSEEQIKEVVTTYNEVMYNTVINHRDGIELPESLGYIFIGSCKAPIKKNVDYGKSETTGVSVINRNLGSDSYLAKIFYTNFEHKYRFKHRKLWKFKGGREFTKAVSEAYKEDWPKYIVVENYVKISSLYREAKIKHKRMKKNNLAVPDKYNEFDFD